MKSPGRENIQVQVQVLIQVQVQILVQGRAQAQGRGQIVHQIVRQAPLMKVPIQGRN